MMKLISEELLDSVSHEARESSRLRMNGNRTEPTHHHRGRKVPRTQAELSLQTDDAPCNPLLQAQRQTVFLLEGRP